jgi:hypothetical protein
MVAAHQGVRDQGRVSRGRLRVLVAHTARVIHYRSLGDENRSISAMPRKRRLAVKASSVAIGHKETSAQIAQ